MKQTKLLVIAMVVMIMAMTGCGMEIYKADPAFLSVDNVTIAVTNEEKPNDQKKPEIIAETLTLTETSETVTLDEDSRDESGETGAAEAQEPKPVEKTAATIEVPDCEEQFSAPETNEAQKEHQHQWVDKIVSHHDAVKHVEHHDAVTEERWVSVPVTVNHFYCDVCLMEFSSQADAYAHEDATMEEAIQANDMSLAHSGHSLIQETVENGYYETVILQEEYDETVIDEPEWDEHRFVCPLCGAEG